MDIFCAKEILEDSNEILKENCQLELITYQCASMQLKTDADLAVMFLKRGGTFSLIGTHFHNQKKNELLADEKILEVLRSLGESLGDHDVFLIFIWQKYREDIRLCMKKSSKNLSPKLNQN